MIEKRILMISSVIILGSGNLAFHLATALNKKGIKVLQIFSRNKVTGNNVARIAGCGFTDNIKSIFKEADAYIFALNDLADSEISSQLETDKNKIFLHTAGSLSMNIFTSKTKNFGVFYPFQTFSTQVELDFSKIPICIEASNSETLTSLIKLSGDLGCQHYEINEEQRKTLHLSGVFACNFMNHCVFLGEKILADNKIPKEILLPLMEQSFSKALENGAYYSQTGPALRNDQISLQKHLDFLKNDKILSDIYRLLSESIFNTYNQKK